MFGKTDVVVDKMWGIWLNLEMIGAGRWFDHIDLYSILWFYIANDRINQKLAFLWSYLPTNASHSSEISRLRKKFNETTVLGQIDY